MFSQRSEAADGSPILGTSAQVVTKLEGALAPRDAQIVALGQACHSLVGNQNFLLQQTMHMINPVQPGKDTDKVILGPDGSRSRGMPRANPDAASGAV